ncbi:MFS transporter [Gorillibacterium timonense]|uniref:MFS transporter n=1 Tax=Gorillibacterium timonense TaxID=1689269 RepID=UPI0009EAE942|nr:MFS transporter [Gorillibacterium timonense]
MNVQKNLIKLYLLEFFHSLIPAYVIERLFWESRGMSVKEVVICEILYAAGVVLLEIPSGAAADRYGRKPLIVAGAFLAMLEMALLLGAHRFWHFAALVLIAAVAKACTSGALNALLYDTLAASSRQKEFEGILGRMNACGILAAVMAALGGSALAAKVNMEWNYVLSAASLLLSLWAALTLREPPLHANGESEKPFNALDARENQAALPSARSGSVRASVRLFGSSPVLIMVLLQGMLLGACLVYLDEFWQLYLNRLSIPVIWFGAYSCLLLAVRLPGSLLAGWLVRRVPPIRIVTGAGVGIVLALLAAGLVPGAVGLAAMASAFLLAGVLEPVVAGFLHHRIDSSMRATAESFQSLGTKAATAAVGLGFGYFTDSMSLYAGFLFLGVLAGAGMLLTGAPMLLRRNRE